MRIERTAPDITEGLHWGLWNSSLDISVEFANRGVDEPHLHGLGPCADWNREKAQAAVDRIEQARRQPEKLAVKVRGDSALVINPVQGTWKTKEPECSSGATSA